MLPLVSMAVFPAPRPGLDMGGCSVNILERIPGFCFREGWARQESEGSEKDTRVQGGAVGELCPLFPGGVSRSEQGLKTELKGDRGRADTPWAQACPQAPLPSQPLPLLQAQKRSF